MKNKDLKITFREMTEKGRKILSNRKPVTIEQARKQVEWLRRNSKINRDEKSQLQG